jgi:hypothetical protein
VSVLQSNSGTSVNVTNPPSAAWTSTLAIGSVVVVTTFNDSGTTNYITGLSGGGVTTWTRRYGVGNIDVWSGVVTSAVTTAVTFGFSAASATRLVWLMQERDDIDATTPFDKISTVATGTSTTATSSTSGTPANANSTIIGHVTMAATATASLGSGYTGLTQAGSATTSARFAAMESKGITSATAQTASFGLSASVAWSCLVSVWKAATTGTAYTPSATDNVGITDAVDHLDVGKGVTDNVGIVDSVAVVQTQSVTPTTDTVGITDSVSAVLSLDIPKTDLVGITDSVSTLYSFGYQSSTIHPIGITDSAAVVQANARTVTDPVGLTDSVALTQANVRSVTDNVGITDSVAAVRGLVAGPTDQVGITDSVSAIISDEFAGEWQYIYVPWGTEQFTIPDLTPGMAYDIQIRAMDAGGNASPWSDSEQLYGALDTVAPSTPAAPTVVSSAIALQVSSTLGKASGGTYNLEADLALLEVHASSTPGFTPTTATKIGTMAADKGIMVAATPAITTFKVDATVAQYVRVIAIDKTGNRSPASATASAVPGLIDSAHISDLTASKITAGTVGADIVVGARIKTANSGARVELNTAGLQAFNTGGTQTVAISSADGSASLTGTLQTGGTGTRIIVQPDIGQPVIKFYPSSGTNFAFINAIDATTAADLGANSSIYGTSPNDYQHRLYLTTSGAFLETFKPVTQTQRGGRIFTDINGAAALYNYDGTYGGILEVLDGITRIGMRNTSNSAWLSYVQVGDDTNIRLVGKFPNGSAQFSNSALFAGGTGVGGGFGAVSFTFGFTMASSMGPIYSVNKGSADFYHCISASSTSGFTVAWSDTSAKTVWYWVFRF